MARWHLKLRIEIMHKSVSYNSNAVQEKRIQTNVKKAKRYRNQRHTPLDLQSVLLADLYFDYRSNSAKNHEYLPRNGVEIRIW